MKTLTLILIGFCLAARAEINLTTNSNGELMFDVVLNVPIGAFSVRMTGSQDRKPALVMCHDDDL